MTHLSGPDHVMLEILVTHLPSLCLHLTSGHWPMRGQDGAPVSQSQARKLSWWLTAAARDRGESGNSQAATALRPTLEIYFRYDRYSQSDSWWKWLLVMFSKELYGLLCLKIPHYFRFCLRCEGGNKVWPSRPGSLLHIRRERASERRFPDSDPVKFSRPWHSTDIFLLCRAHPCSWGLQQWLLQRSKNRPEMSFGSMFK